MRSEDICDSLVRAGRLSILPIIVCAVDDPPEGAEPLASIDGCVAKAVFMIATEASVPGYIGPSARAGCCPGGQAWLGLSAFSKRLSHFVSTGHPDFMKGEAEYLKRCPEMVDESRESIGEITMPGENILLCRKDDIPSGANTLSVILFGKAEGIRNLCSLAHFGTSNALGAVILPWGPMCASLITYPAGMASRVPADSAILGPTDPTVNAWFPPDMMSLSLPIHLACRMADDLGSSFIEKRPEVAYPDRASGSR